MDMKFLTCFLIIVYACLLGSCGDQAEGGGEGARPLFFSAIPDDDESLLKARFEPMAAYLSEALGRPVIYKPVTSYPLAVQAMKSGDIHLAWFGGLTGVQARALTHGEAIAMGEADAAFYSYFIAHPSSGLKPSKNFPRGIVGKTFTFGSKSSTSGRLMPEAYIRQYLGKSPDELFPKVGFSGSHNLTVEAVGRGAFQVGAVNGKTFEKMKAENKAGEARIIWKTPFYADYNWSVHGEIDDIYGEGFKDRLQKALLALDYRNPRHKRILDAFQRRRFIAAANKDFQGIKDTADALGVTRP